MTAALRPQELRSDHKSNAGWLCAECRGDFFLPGGKLVNVRHSNELPLNIDK